MTLLKNTEAQRALRIRLEDDKAARSAYWTREAERFDIATDGQITGTTPDEDANTSVVHLVPDLEGRIITLSRPPVPCAFREALSRFTSWVCGPVERAESIEFLRFLEHGERIACTSLEHRSVGVDRLEDTEKVEAIIQNQDK